MNTYEIAQLLATPPALCRNVIASGRVVYKESDALENLFELAVLARMRDERVRLNRWLLNPPGGPRVERKISPPGGKVKHGPPTRRHPEDGP